MMSASGIQILRVTPLEWAIAMHESEGNLAPRGPAGEPTAKRKAFRPEPGFLVNVVPRHRLAHTWGTEFRAAMAMSFGCWQIMGLNLFDLGYQWPIDEFANSAEMQLHYMRLQWRRGTDPGDPLWRNVESWNKGDAGEDRLTAPTTYFNDVNHWLLRAPAPGPDGLVELVTVEKAIRRKSC